jgi:hypothetical protein
MNPGAAAGANAAVMAAAVAAQAIKASGAIVRVEPDQFAAILGKQQAPLVVEAEGGFFSRSFQYLNGYKGLVFFTKSPSPLFLPAGAEVVKAKRIWIPS